MLRDLCNEKVISQEDLDFVRDKTTFLFHREVMSEKYSVFHLMSSETFSDFWSEIENQFPKEKRRLFWNILMQTCDNSLYEYPPLLTDLQIVNLKISWKKTTLKLLPSISS